MPIPRSRQELIDLVTGSFSKLKETLDGLEPGSPELSCVDDWSIKDLLAVRAWWTERVIDWVEAGRRGEDPVTPAPGYGWRETPRLNAAVVRAAQDQSYREVRDRLEAGYCRALATIDALDDRELLEPGVFAWTGKYPVSRLISINTARQYTTARTFIRRAVRSG